MTGRVTLMVVLCHFVAAFTALGLPPYLTEALRSMGGDQSRWAGILYILPTICVAISAPFWGKMADRYGSRKLLIRAQLGLAISYFLTSQANTPLMLALSLMLQGLLGGTFSASSAYLGNHLKGKPLSRALTLMQSSARLALLVAPVLVGILIQHHGVLQLYGWFCLLPLVSALLTIFLPEAPVAPKHEQPQRKTSLRAGQRVFWLEFLFVLSTILSFPYFIDHISQQTPLSWVPGLLFSLPHLAYLLVVPLLHRLPQGWTLGAGFVLVGLSLLWHLWTTDLILLGLLRLVLGFGMALCISSVNDLAAELAEHHPRGQLFGVLEAYGKGGAVMAGILASLLSTHMEWTFWLSGTIALLSVLLTLSPARRYQQAR